MTSLTKSILKIVEHLNGATIEEITKILHRNKDTAILEGVDIDRDAIMSRVKAMFADQTVDLVEWRTDNRQGCRVLVLPKSATVHYTEQPEEIVTQEEFSTPSEFELVAAKKEIVDLKNEILRYKETVLELQALERLNELTTSHPEHASSHVSVEIGDLVTNYLVRHGISLELFDDAEQAQAVYSRVLEQSTTQGDKPELFAMIPVKLKVSHLVAFVESMPKLCGTPHHDAT